MQQLLDDNEIISYLTQYGFCTPYKLHLFSTIDSTNQFLKHRNSSSLVEICCAEQQTQGRGRFGRHWHSPFGENIYCSSRWNLDCPLSALSGLGLVTSLAILTTLKQFNPLPDIKIKWPNDILWDNKKLCGSLIEIIDGTHHLSRVIIGIGININSDTRNHPLEDKAWCSLYEITNKQFNRNLIIAHLIINLERYLNQFLSDGLGSFLSEWKKVDYLADKQITVTQSNITISGRSCGINDSGQLILEDKQGTRHYLCSGDTTVKQFA